MKGIVDEQSERIGNASGTRLYNTHNLPSLARMSSPAPTATVIDPGLDPARGKRAITQNGNPGPTGEAPGRSTGAPVVRSTAPLRPSTLASLTISEQPDSDPFGAGEQPSKRAKPDARSAAANSRARTKAEPPLPTHSRSRPRSPRPRRSLLLRRSPCPRHPHTPHSPHTLRLCTIPIPLRPLCLSQCTRIPIISSQCITNLRGPLRLHLHAFPFPT